MHVFIKSNKTMNSFRMKLILLSITWIKNGEASNKLESDGMK